MNTKAFTRDGFYLEIEGVPIRIGYGHAPSENAIKDHSGADTGFTYRHIKGLTEAGEGTSDSIDPVSGSFSVSDETFQMVASVETRQLFLFQQLTRQGTVVSDDGGSISISPAPNPAYPGGQILHIGGEAVLIQSETSSGVYEVSRGVLGTAQKDQEGASVFDRVPRWRGRVAALWSVEDGISRRRWLGYIEETKTNTEGTRIVLPCRNIWGALSGTTLNREGKTRSRSFFQRSAGRLVGRADTNTRFIEVLEGVHQQSTPDEAEITSDSEGKALLGSSFDLGPFGNIIHSEAYPLFITGKATDEELRMADPATGDPVAGGQLSPEAKYPYHPLTTACFIITGLVLDRDGDFVPLDREDSADDFSLLLGNMFSDAFFENIKTLTERTSFFEMDHFILGEEGESFDPISVIQNKLLRPYGFIFGVRQNGEPSIAQFSLPTVLQTADATANDRFINAMPSPFIGRFTLAQGSAHAVISAEIGSTPWRDGVQINISVAGDANRSRLNDKGRFTLDYSTISRDRAQEIAENVRSTGIISNFAMPILTVRAPDAKTDFQYDLGELVKLNNLPVKGAYLVGPAGNIVEDLTGDRWFGTVVEKKYDRYRRVYELRVLLTSYRTGILRLRSPGAVVTGVESAGPDSFALTLDDPFSVDGPIAESFDPAAELYFLDEHFSPKHTDANAMTFGRVLDDTVIEVIGTAYTPEVDDIVRNAGYSRLGGETEMNGLQVWNFLSATTAGLPGGDNPMVYG